MQATLEFRIDGINIKQNKTLGNIEEGIALQNCRLDAVID